MINNSYDRTIQASNVSLWPAIGAAIAEHWGGQRGNIADVLAKNGAQHTMLSLIGLSVSVPFAKYANADTPRLFGLYAILTALHIYSNIKAMKALALRSLNLIRYQMLLTIFTRNHLIQSLFESHINNYITNPNPLQNNSNNKMIENIAEETLKESLNSTIEYNLDQIAAIEPLFIQIIPSFLRFDKLIDRLLCRRSDALNVPNVVDNEYIHLWSSISSASKQGASSASIRSSMSVYQDEKYMILASDSSKSKDCVYHLCFRQDFDNLSIAKGILEVYLLQRLSALRSKSLPISLESHHIDMKYIRRFIDQLFPVFWAHLSSLGWDTNRLLLTEESPVVYQYAMD